jgi:hypothetical protein
VAEEVRREVIIVVVETEDEDVVVQEGGVEGGVHESFGKTMESGARTGVQEGFSA